MKRKKVNTLLDLFYKADRVTKAVSSITLYRIIAAPLLLILFFLNYVNSFKILLAVSFFTDLMDGYLARKFKANSVIGSLLDSVGDDLTMFVAIIALFIKYSDFVNGHYFIIAFLFSLFSMHIIVSIIYFGKVSNFHTYAAKLAAILQGVFLLFTLIFDRTYQVLFYSAAIVTSVQIIEEIILVLLLPVLKNDIKGLYWVLWEENDYYV
jgi:CDP-diacylglycerol--glycerol-3-phosphate 3-phosphatidyltransferase